MLVIVTSKLMAILVVCVVVLVGGIYLMLPRTYIASVTLVSPSPSSTSTTRCWIYDKIFPATAQAYKSAHASVVEKQEVEKWAVSVPTSQRSLVRWMRDPYNAKFVYVFVAHPLYPTVRTPWSALNANVFVDTVDCEIGAFPRA